MITVINRLDLRRDCIWIEISASSSLTDLHHYGYSNEQVVVIVEQSLIKGLRHICETNSVKVLITVNPSIHSNLHLSGLCCSIYYVT